MRPPMFRSYTPPWYKASTIVLSSCTTRSFCPSPFMRMKRSSQRRGSPPCLPMCFSMWRAPGGPPTFASG
eukprot:213856-Pyramimonas_sp.AAC.1